MPWSVFWYPERWKCYSEQFLTNTNSNPIRILLISNLSRQLLFFDGRFVSSFVFHGSISSHEWFLSPAFCYNGELYSSNFVPLEYNLTVGLTYQWFFPAPKGLTGYLLRMWFVSPYLFPAATFWWKLLENWFDRATCNQGCTRLVSVGNLATTTPPSPFGSKS